MPHHILQYRSCQNSQQSLLTQLIDLFCSATAFFRGLAEVGSQSTCVCLLYCCCAHQPPHNEIGDVPDSTLHVSGCLSQQHVYVSLWICCWLQLCFCLLAAQLFGCSVVRKVMNVLCLRKEPRGDVDVFLMLRTASTTASLISYPVFRFLMYTYLMLVYRTSFFPMQSPMQSLS